MTVTGDCHPSGLLLGLGRYLLISIVLFLSSLVPETAFAKRIDKPEEGYSLFLPKPRSDGSKVPIVVVLPGRGSLAENDIKPWTWRAGKKRLAILDLSIDYDRFEAETDLDLLQELISKLTHALSSQYDLDRTRLYLGGSSAGGALAIALALKYPGHYQGVGVLGGSSLAFGARDYLTGAKGQKFFLIHGEDDDVIPIKALYFTQDHLEANGGLVKSKVLSDEGHSLPESSYEEVVDWISRLESGPSG